MTTTMTVTITMRASLKWLGWQCIYIGKYKSSLANFALSGYRFTRMSVSTNQFFGSLHICRPTNRRPLYFRACERGGVIGGTQLTKTTQHRERGILQGSNSSKVPRLKRPRQRWRDFGQNNARLYREIIIIIIYPLTARVVWTPQMISQPVFSIFLVLRCPMGRAELQACPFLDVVFNNNRQGDDDSKMSRSDGLRQK